MTRHKLLVDLGAVGAMVGMATALNSAAAYADPGDPLAGSDTAIILGGTGEPMPSTEFAQAAEDLYLLPAGFRRRRDRLNGLRHDRDRPVRRAAAGADHPRAVPAGPGRGVHRRDQRRCARRGERIQRRSGRVQRRAPADDLRILPERQPPSRSQ